MATDDMTDRDALHQIAKLVDAAEVDAVRATPYAYQPLVARAHGFESIAAVVQQWRNSTERCLLHEDCVFADESTTFASAAYRLRAVHCYDKSCRWHGKAVK